jgi:hypothetical protein
MSAEAVDLVSGLLKKDPEQRLGAASGNDIKSHAFFRYA